MLTKGFKWRFTMKLFKAYDIIKHSDKQLFRAILKSDHCLNELLPSRKLAEEFYKPVTENVREGEST